MHIGKVFNLLIILIAVGYLPEHTMAQEKLTSAVVEDTSYSLYNGKDWKELIAFGNKALHQGFDYYYLRVRLGIAYYERGNYMSADKQFRKALAFNNADPVAEEYLYLCYVYTSRFEEARKLSKSFTKKVARQMGTDSLSTIGDVIMEGGTKVSDSSRQFQNATYAQVGLGHYVNNSFSLFHAATYYNEAEFRGKTSQFQYYLLGTVPLSNGWEISPAFQWLYRLFTPPPPLRLPPPGKGGPHMGPPPQNPEQPPATPANYLIGSLQVRKTIGHFFITLGGCVSNIDSAMQYMQTASLSYLPLGNNRLIFGAQGYLVESNMYGKESAISPFISAMPFKRLTLSASYLNSTVFHLIEDNGYIVNNSFDLTPSRWTFQGLVSLSKNVSVYALYQLENKIESIAKFNYNYQAFIIGLKFTP